MNIERFHIFLPSIFLPQILRRIFLSSIFLSLVSFAQPATAGLYETSRGPFSVMVEKGQAKAQIVTPAEPTHLEEFAALELQAYLHKISGAKLPIVKEGIPASLPYSIYLGDTRKAAKSGITSNERKMGLDGFTLRSVRSGLVVRGQNDLGTVFGVYELLERNFDVRWFMPGEIGEYVPKHDTLKLGKLDLTYKPSFRVRRIGEGDWSLHQRMNAFVTAGTFTPSPF
jgi:hypothetical protein